MANDTTATTTIVLTSLLSSLTSLPPSSTSSATPDLDDVPSIRKASPVVAFIIGFSIILLASLLNAGGLNLTKLDHVRTMALPRASRRSDFFRPLWVLGMVLYILSQLIGSSLALEYMRAEYVAPLGSSSLIFNFLFSSLLIGTPVTRNDIYGTAVVIFGVIGIVAFGSINSGLKEDFSLELLSHLWARSGWITYFSFMTTAIIIQYICNTQLNAVYIARSEISVLPTHRTSNIRAPSRGNVFTKIIGGWQRAMKFLRDILEAWSAPKDDKTVAWILGIGWSCGGGAMAGGSLVFAKATVKLLSGSLNHTSSGNQFLHPAAIFTVILLALSAIFQIICLNRGLKVYDSTLVVPTFYAVYTASGFLNSLLFMDEVDAYNSWTLFAIFVSIAVLIGGVVLLTIKKPEPKPAPTVGNTALGPVPPRAIRRKGKGDDDEDGDAEDYALRRSEDGEDRDRDRDAVVWQIGDDDDDDTQTIVEPPPNPKGVLASSSGLGTHIGNDDDDDDPHGEARGLMSRHVDDDDAEDEGEDVRKRRQQGDDVSRTDDQTRPYEDDFGDWEDGGHAGNRTPTR